MTNLIKKLKMYFISYGSYKTLGSGESNDLSYKTENIIYIET